MRALIDFVSTLSSPAPPRTVIVTEADGEKAFTVEPRQVRLGIWLLGVAPALAAVLLIAFTPVRFLVPGYPASDLRQQAVEAAVRLEALQDTVALQERQLEFLKRLLTGTGDTTATADFSFMETESDILPRPVSAAILQEGGQENPVGQADAEAITTRAIIPLPSGRMPIPAPSLVLPSTAPVSGFASREFNASTGHYGIDISTPEGRVVRSVGDGHVVFADWTHGSGHTVMVQHAGGYLSVYKHNQRLLKSLADRVEPRESIALSGNSGQHTTGPHLHFELWKDGQALDPGHYLVGL